MWDHPEATLGVSMWNIHNTLSLVTELPKGLKYRITHASCKLGAFSLMLFNSFGLLRVC